MESVGYSGGAEGAGQGLAFDDGGEEEEKEGEPRKRDAMGMASAGRIYSSPAEEGRKSRGERGDGVPASDVALV